MGIESAGNFLWIDLGVPGPWVFFASLIVEN